MPRTPRRARARSRTTARTTSDSRAVPLSTRLSSRRSPNIATVRSSGRVMGTVSSGSSTRNPSTHGSPAGRAPAAHARASTTGTAYEITEQRPELPSCPPLPEDDRERPLARRRVRGDVAQVVDHEDRGDQRPRRHRGREEHRVEPERLEVRRPDDRHQPEEDEHEHLAQRPVAVRERPARVRERGDDRERAERDEHRAADRREPQPHDARQQDHDPDGDLQLALRDEARRRHARGTLPRLRVRAAPEVREVVREVRRDLEEERHEDAADRRVEAERRPHGERGTKTDGDPGDGRRQRGRAGREQPDPDRRRAGRRGGGGRRGRGRGRTHGRRGYVR